MHPMFPLSLEEHWRRYYSQILQESFRITPDQLSAKCFENQLTFAKDKFKLSGLGSRSSNP